MMKMRDLKADLELVKTAQRFFGNRNPAMYIQLGQAYTKFEDNNMEVAEHALERAIKAEALVRELVGAMNSLLYEYEDLILRLPCSTPVRGQPIHYNSQAAKQAENLLTKAKEVLGDE